jgi:hypothetical protein
VREFRSHGSVRGALRNGRPYRKHHPNHLLPTHCGHYLSGSSRSNVGTIECARNAKTSWKASPTELSRKAAKVRAQGSTGFLNMAVQVRRAPPSTTNTCPVA